MCGLSYFHSLTNIVHNIHSSKLNVLSTFMLKCGESMTYIEACKLVQAINCSTNQHLTFSLISIKAVRCAISLSSFIIQASK